MTAFLIKMYVYIYELKIIYEGAESVMRKEAYYLMALSLLFNMTAFISIYYYYHPALSIL